MSTLLFFHFFTFLLSFLANVSCLIHMSVSFSKIYRLSEKLASSLQTPPVPVVVVTRETGRELARLLEEHPRELEARIETALKGPLSPSVSSTTSPSRSELPGLWKETLSLLWVLVVVYTCLLCSSIILCTYTYVYNTFFIPALL